KWRSAGGADGYARPADRHFASCIAVLRDRLGIWQGLGDARDCGEASAPSRRSGCLVDDRGPELQPPSNPARRAAGHRAAASAAPAHAGWLAEALVEDSPGAGPAVAGAPVRG